MIKRISPKAKWICNHNRFLQPMVMQAIESQSYMM